MRKDMRYPMLNHFKTVYATTAISGIVLSTTVLMSAVFLLSACHHDIPPIEAVSVNNEKYALDWFMTADVAEEIELAKLRKDYTLFSVARRGYSIPNNNNLPFTPLSQQCGHRLITELGDMVNKTSHERLLKAERFIREYNTQMIEVCLDRQAAQNTTEKVVVPSKPQ